MQFRFRGVVNYSLCFYMILFQTFALLNALGSGDSSSSPSIAQKPPIGKILSEYLVSPFPKEKIFDVMKELNHVVVKAPVHREDVIVSDICGTGVDLVATKDL